jgi:hypothetical protein
VTLQQNRQSIFVWVSCFQFLFLFLAENMPSTWFQVFRRW